MKNFYQIEIENDTPIDYLIEDYYDECMSNLKFDMNENAIGFIHKYGLDMNLYDQVFISLNRLWDPVIEMN